MENFFNDYFFKSDAQDFVLFDESAVATICFSSFRLDNYDNSSILEALARGSL